MKLSTIFRIAQVTLFVASFALFAIIPAACYFLVPLEAGIVCSAFCVCAFSALAFTFAYHARDEKEFYMRCKRIQPSRIFRI
jgi:hypothetical protein